MPLRNALDGLEVTRTTFDVNRRDLRLFALRVNRDEGNLICPNVTGQRLVEEAPFALRIELDFALAKARIVD